MQEKQGSVPPELPAVKISVRNLVEFLLRTGDIDNRTGSVMRSDAMQEGSRIHRKIQHRMGASYRAEVPLKWYVDTPKYRLMVEGRADGIMDGNPVTVDEIKGVYLAVNRMEEPVFVHKAQAMCYAYIYGSQNGCSTMGVQMTYCNLDTEEIWRFEEVFSMVDLENWFYTLIEQYTKWADFQYDWHRCMVESVRQLEFPYAYRTGQKELAQDVYRTILREKTLFIQAPTGTGKTLSVIYPAVKAAGEDVVEKIFYLTAKTVTGTVAKETLELFAQKGSRLKVMCITAKEKLCLCDEMACDPLHCACAKGHYDRVNDAVFALLQKADFFSRELLLAQAEEYQVCPFELCLDTAVWCDVIICDYNYVFDPNVRLKRFFAEGLKGDYLFLVDEAHNLVERGRNMYSAQLCKEEILAVKKLFPDKTNRVVKQLERCNKLLLEYKRTCDTCQVYREELTGLLFALMRLAENLDLVLQSPAELPSRTEITEFYLNLRNFLRVYDVLDDHYVTYSDYDEDGHFVLHLFCVDPSRRIQECLDKGRAAVLFSATLLPVTYYKDMLSDRTDDYAIYAHSVFADEQKLLLIGRDVSSRYTRRTEEEFHRIASYIREVTGKKQGNYMVFFPSYRLLEQVYEAYLPMSEGRALLKQESGMKESEREAFLDSFKENGTQTLVAFCVLGGIFGEGIDLKEEQLIGAVIVGTGLPQIGNEREILKNYYEEKSGNGFDYAYRYPGMNKVLQAAGRVIRTGSDRGVIVLLDERFLESSYKNLFPREWSDYQICSVEHVADAVEAFWNNCEVH